MDLFWTGHGQMQNKIRGMGRICSCEGCEGVGWGGEAGREGGEGFKFYYCQKYMI